MMLSNPIRFQLIQNMNKDFQFLFSLFQSESELIIFSVIINLSQRYIYNPDINKRIYKLIMDPEKVQRKGGRRSQNEKVSRTLASILRHKATEVGLNIDAAGYVRLKDVIDYLNKKGFQKVDEAVIRDVVENNDKKRFQIEQRGKHLCIRATQGHSMKEVQTEELLNKITDPTLYPIVLHGTFFKFWNLIKKEGLKRMSRNHIHFAPGMPKENGVISGMRATCDIYITIDLVAAMKDGINFYVSSNNVILTEGVNGILAPKYFKEVRSRKGEDMLKKDLKEEEEGQEKSEKVEKKVEEQQKKGKKKEKGKKEKKEQNEE